MNTFVWSSYTLNNNLLILSCIKDFNTFVIRINTNQDDINNIIDANNIDENNIIIIKNNGHVLITIENNNYNLLNILEEGNHLVNIEEFKTNNNYNEFLDEITWIIIYGRVLLF